VVRVGESTSLFAVAERTALCSRYAPVVVSLAVFSRAFLCDSCVVSVFCLCVIVCVCGVCVVCVLSPCVIHSLSLRVPSRTARCATQVITRPRGKANFQCRICRERQSVRKVYATSYAAKDVRPIVQELNMRRAHEHIDAQTRKRSRLSRAHIGEEESSEGENACVYEHEREGERAHAHQRAQSHPGSPLPGESSRGGDPRPAQQNAHGGTGSSVSRWSAFLSEQKRAEDWERDERHTSAEDEHADAADTRQLKDGTLVVVLHEEAPHTGAGRSRSRSRSRRSESDSGSSRRMYTHTNTHTLRGGDGTRERTGGRWAQVSRSGGSGTTSGSTLRRAGSKVMLSTRRQTAPSEREAKRCTAGGAVTSQSEASARRAVLTSLLEARELDASRASASCTFSSPRLSSLVSTASSSWTNTTTLKDEPVDQVQPVDGRDQNTGELGEHTTPQQRSESSSVWDHATARRTRREQAHPPLRRSESGERTRRENQHGSVLVLDEQDAHTLQRPERSSEKHSDTACVSSRWTAFLPTTEERSARGGGGSRWRRRPLGSELSSSSEEDEAGFVF
jgi:MRN-interacting protein